AYGKRSYRCATRLAALRPVDARARCSQFAAVRRGRLSAFSWQARVYWEDTDAGGIVYYANYLRFLERARTEWLRARGISQSALAVDPGVVFSVVEVQARYHRPARLDDELLIGCEAVREGGASMAFGQHIWH